ncbi:hypothetical protein [Nocardia bovistercoris]|uniref:Secreted protein n=1 Tax=Nocardia bovistercoris TaxID=2785916 RepID=A0A931N745_9NOCA|nr:hypothetical protein [Nocardia bovistercoris]MBH0781402.1 hypothetical protein [Nocardia bovistercoris]
MATTVRRLVIRSGVAVAVAAGSLLVFGPQAAADAPCPDGTARIFFNNSTNICQGAGTATYSSPWASRVCTTSGTKVVIDTTGKRRVNKRHIELDGGGYCTQLELNGQENATIQVSPA